MTKLKVLPDEIDHLLRYSKWTTFLLQDDLLYFSEFTIDLTRLLYCIVILHSVWTLLAGLFERSVIRTRQAFGP